MVVKDDEFIRRSTLEISIPQTTGINISEYFDTNNAESDDAEQRSLLFFDEHIDAYVVLRTVPRAEAQLRDLFVRLHVDVEIQAYGFQSRPSSRQNTSNESSPSRSEDSLWSGTIDTSELPVIITQGEEKKHGDLLAVWKTTIPLSRPRMRLQTPIIVFKLSATLRPRQEDSIDKPQDPYLPSAVPESANLLEPLKKDPLTQKAMPKLSAERLSRISPKTDAIDTASRTIKIRVQRTYRALPAISSRVRYSKMNSPMGRPSIIASLDIETAPFSSETIKLTSTDMDLWDGSTEDLGKSVMPILPIKCRSKDNVVFLFRLTPLEGSSDNPNQTSARTVLITVHATVYISPSCQPRIEMRWKTGVDFSTALNPTYGPPGQSMQRQRRPENLSRTLSNTNLNSMPPSVQETKSTSGVTQKRQRAVSVSDFGVSVNLTGPEGILIGHPFSWDVLVVNRSRKPRELALTALPKRRKEVIGHSSKPSSSLPRDREETSLADPVIDEGMLYTNVHDCKEQVSQVAVLSTDVSTGILNPDSCINLELKLLALAQGQLQLEAIRVTDLVSKESINIRDLPDIAAQKDSVLE